MLTGRLNLVIKACVICGTIFTLFTPQTAYSRSKVHDFLVHIFAPVRINKLDDLEFGKIVPDTLLASTVIVSAQADDTSTCGALLLCLEDGDRAEFRVTGRIAQFATISVSNSTTLSNGSGGTMLVDNFTTNSTYGGGLLGLITGAGKVDVGVGATLHIGANQPVGDYTGTFVVTASYQ